MILIYEFSGGCCQITSGIVRNFAVWFLSWVRHMQLRTEEVAFLVKWIVSSTSLLNLILYFRPSVPRRRSICCVCSKLTFLYGMVSFTTGVTSYIGVGYLSIRLLVLFALVLLEILLLECELRVCLTTIFDVFLNAGILFVVLGMVFVFTALVLVRTWLCAVVTSWFEFFWILLRHSIYLQLIWSFQSIHFQFSFRMWHNLLNYVILQMRLTNRFFFQVGRHFGIYKLVGDCLSGNSEWIFCYFWSSSKKTITSWFTGLKTSEWTLCNFVSIDWCSKCFLRNRVWIPPKFPLLGLVMFLNVCKVSKRIRE